MDVKFHQAYGTRIKTVGVGLSIISVFGAFNMWLGLKGSLQHNKFILSIHAVFDGMCFLIHLYLGWSIVFVTFSPFDAEDPEVRIYIDGRSKLHWS